MKILHTVEFYAPSIGGSQEVVRQISERMAAMGHDVTVATSFLPEREFSTLNRVKIKQFKISGNEVRGYKGDVKEYQDFILTSKFDVVMNYAAQEWTADLIFPLLDKIKCRKIFVPCGYSALSDPLYSEYFKKMPNVLRQYDATIYLANKYRDIDFARQHKIKNIHIVPNGADEREFLNDYDGDIRSELRIPQESKMIMHLGSFTGLKGQSEAIEIYRRTKSSNTVLLMVGNVFNQSLYRKLRMMATRFNLTPANIRSKKRILIKQLDRRRTVASLKAADVFLFPSNIEASPLVLFEACAAKTPFLTTDVGNAQEIVKWTQGGRVLPTSFDGNGYAHPEVRGSAKMLDDLLSNESECSALAGKGYSAWSKKFRWDKIASQYLTLYKGGL
ncbi:glycosyltransferase family 4 protein [bacterium]|nr:glycosyltransferase family 4 protein [bacterium]